ncbi:MAG: hypothetical protein ACYDAJ_06640 [Nitrosotalea sp.]
MTFSFTVNSGSNTLLLVGMEASTGTVTGMTFNGVALTKAVARSNVGDSELWYLVNPSVTTANVVITLSTAATVVAGAYELTGVDQTTPIGNTGTNSGITNAPSVSITTAYSNSWAIDSVSITSTTITGAGAGQTVGWNVSDPSLSPVVSGATSYRIPSAAGTTVAFSWTAGTINNFADVAAEIKAAIAYTVSNSDGFTTSDNPAISPTISISPTSGNVGETITVSGSGFVASHSVTIKYDGTTQTTTGTCTTDASGNLPSANNCAFTAPASTSGSHTVTTTDGTNTASDIFTVGAGVTVPSAPILQDPTPKNNGITITWTATNDGGSQIISYVIYRGTSSGGEASLTSVSGSTLSYVDTAIAAGQVYYYQITATNEVGESSRSSELGGEVSNPAGTSNVSPMDPIVSILIPSATTLETLNYGSTSSVTLIHHLNITATTTYGNFEVSIPPDTTIGNSTCWTGTLDLPMIFPTTSVIAPAGTTVKSVIGIGSSGCSLQFNTHAVKMVFSGYAGHRVGFSISAEPLKEITQVCADDTQSTNDALLGSGGACKIDSGSDLHVWTSHFTKFGIFSSSGTHSDTTPGFAPSFTVGFIPSEYPISINGTNFTPSNYTKTTSSTVQLVTGKPFLLNLLLYGDYGPSSVQHVTIFTNLRDNARELQNSDTVISWDKSDRPQLSVIDPHGYFGPVTVDAISHGNNLELDYMITFAKPMASSDLIVRAWGTDLYVSNTYLLNAWRSVLGSLQIPSSNLLGTSSAIPNSTTTNTQQPTDKQSSNSADTQSSEQVKTQKSDLLQSIKDWGGYSSNPISDSRLLSYLGMRGTHISPWVAKTARWVVSGDMTEQEFVNVIQYLDKSGMIK